MFDNQKNKTDSMHRHRDQGTSCDIDRLQEFFYYFPQYNLTSVLLFQRQCMKANGMYRYLLEKYKSKKHQLKN